jgi:hypothetical protein
MPFRAPSPSSRRQSSEKARALALKLGLLGGLLLMAAAACQGPPPTEYVIITATPTIAPQVIVVTATPEPAQATQTALSGTAVGVVQAATATDAPPQAASATATRRRRATPTLDPMPTPTISDIQVAEQLFENGRMFWLQPTNQIWVMVETGAGTGIWTVHDDLFVEGDVEFDPRIVPPTGLLQPERGFGRLWRDNAEVQEAVGWAVESEVGHVSRYEYRPAGEVVDGEYVPAPGYHILSSIYGEVFRFNEINGTWQTLGEAEE